MWDDVVNYNGISEKVYKEFKEEIFSTSKFNYDSFNINYSLEYDLMIAFKEFFLDPKIENLGFFIDVYYKIHEIDFKNTTQIFFRIPLLDFKLVYDKSMNLLTLYEVQYDLFRRMPDYIELGSLHFYENEISLKDVFGVLKKIFVAILPMIPKPIINPNRFNPKLGFFEEEIKVIEKVFTRIQKKSINLLKNDVTINFLQSLIVRVWVMKKNSSLKNYLMVDVFISWRFPPNKVIIFCCL